MINMLR